MRSLIFTSATSSTASSSSGSDAEDEEHLNLNHQQQQQQVLDSTIWGVEDSTALYRIRGWGSPFFSINMAGELCVHPQSTAIPLRSIIRKVVESSGGNLAPPLIIRFPQIVRSKVASLQSAFDAAVLHHSYRRHFQGVFPVKCNPDRLLVEELVASGKEFGFGLEAGSKPELLLAMSCLCSERASPSAFLICNGYKDEEYVELAMVARGMGINCVVVVEQVEEIDLVVRVSRRLGVQPVIGVRSKLNTKHGGHWGDTCGDSGKFGLSCGEILEVVHRLKLHGMLRCMQLLHFHIGSQIPCLDIVRESVTEAAHLLCELALLGADMQVLDIGGGIGVNYDGSGCSDSDLSVGYSVHQYAEVVVGAVSAACAVKGMVQVPVICCESGRGMVSHQSVLVFDVYSASKPAAKVVKDEVLVMCQQLEVEAEYYMPGLAQLAGAVEDESYGLAMEYAKILKNEAASLFKAGVMSLGTRAGVERLHEMVLAMAASATGTPVGRAATYHMNLSMFKAIPDTWAIGQLFPIVPLQRLDEQPTVRAILSDLTCDSDGRISSFLCGVDDKSAPSGALPVHDLDEDKGPYYLGLFLAGAYQEALSSMHNLFGAIHAVHVVDDEGDGSFRISHETPGHSIAAALRCAHYHPGNMFDTLRRRVVASLSQARFASESHARSALHLLARSFSSYTYLATTSTSTSTSTSATSATATATAT